MKECVFLSDIVKELRADARSPLILSPLQVSKRECGAQGPAGWKCLQVQTA